MCIYTDQGSFWPWNTCIVYWGSVWSVRVIQIPLGKRDLYLADHAYIWTRDLPSLKYLYHGMGICLIYPCHTDPTRKTWFISRSCRSCVCINQGPTCPETSIFWNGDLSDLSIWSVCLLSVPSHHPDQVSVRETALATTASSMEKPIGCARHWRSFLRRKFARNFPTQTVRRSQYST